MIKMAELPLAVVIRMIKSAGAERVSEDAGEALRDVLEAKAEEVAKKAISLANHAKRKTLKKEDIAEAVKEL